MNVVRARVATLQNEALRVVAKIRAPVRDPPTPDGATWRAAPRIPTSCSNRWRAGEQAG